MFFHRYCVTCHDYDTGANKPFVMAESSMTPIYSNEGRVFGLIQTKESFSLVDVN